MPSASRATSGQGCEEGRGRGAPGVARCLPAGAQLWLGGFCRLGAPPRTQPPGLYTSPPLPPLCLVWELKLLSLRFPQQVAPQPAPVQGNATEPWAGKAAGPSRGSPDAPAL